MEAVLALGALAQSTRLSIFRLLVQAGPDGSSVGKIAASLDVSAPTLSFHLKELAHAALIEARQDGRYVYYSANFGRMNDLLHYLTEHCCEGDAAQCRPAPCPPLPSRSAPQRKSDEKIPRARRGR